MVIGLRGVLFQSVIIQVINKIQRPQGRPPICLMKSMITDGNGQHEVLLSINGNYYNKMTVIF